MFEKAPHQRKHANILRNRRQLRAEAARAAHDQVDLQPSVRGLIQLANDRGVDQRVQLREQARRFTACGALSLFANFLHQAGTQRAWRNGELAIRDVARKAGQ
jgi:hypothetical protein